MNETPLYRCEACGFPIFDPGYCEACSPNDDGEIRDGGRCLACKRQVDFLEPNGLCCPCDLAASEQSTGGNRGR